MALRLRAAPRLTEPASTYEVDPDLWEVLDMATDEELERIHGVLYGAREVVSTCEQGMEVQVSSLRGQDWGLIDP